MLESLHVKNLALIDEQEVSFSEGMNILTGETGTGKSIIIGSINLALGAKADKEYIRTGADYALVELIFSLNDQQSAHDQVHHIGLKAGGNESVIPKEHIDRFGDGNSGKDVIVPGDFFPGRLLPCGIEHEAED